MYLDLEEDPFRERGRRNKKKNVKKTFRSREQEKFSREMRNLCATLEFRHIHTQRYSPRCITYDFVSYIRFSETGCMNFALNSVPLLHCTIS